MTLDEEMKNSSGNSCSDDNGNIIFYNESIQKVYKFAKQRYYKIILRRG